jgi:glucose-6-phosphate-specific signal transduction histidine kinase
MACAAFNNAAQFSFDRASAFHLTVVSSPMSKHSDQVVNDIAGRYFLVLGAAAADLWSELPQDLQQQLFERAVLLGHQGEQDESLREQLAKFLHDHHERTAQAIPGR